MGIFDEAIKEHLELKRQHGADDSELKQLEDEAFGPPERPGGEEVAPDPFAEAPTEFMMRPEVAEAQGPETAEEAPARRLASDIADLQEAPEPEEQPAEEEQPAMEHEAIVTPDEAIAEHEPVPESGEPEAAPTTDERQAIAEEPTQLYDVEGEFASGEPRAPSEEELVEEEIGEPRLAPVDPLGGLEPDEGDRGVEGAIGAEPAEVAEKEEEEDDEEEDDDFFDEQRLSDELDQALEAPEELEPEEEGLKPEEDREPEKEPASQGRDEDLLEETPDFLEEAPEDDRLWFEQKPPKDFDFDD
jgi:hypothetical protein